MNIHPIFVHFPVAFLTIYTLMEFVGFKFLTRHPAWFYIKAFLLIVGTASAYIAMQTGEIIEHQFRGGAQEKLLEMHSLWANITLFIFGVLSVFYLAAFIKRDLSAAPGISKIIQIPGISHAIALCARLYDVVTGGVLILIGALAGLASITIVGALGGALAYGPNIDPVVTFIYHLFF